MIVDGKAYEIKGVTLYTVKKGGDRKDLVLNLSNVGESNIRKMQEAGINTVRTYVAPKNDLLDAFSRYGIKVIVGFPNYDDRYSSGADIQSGTYKSYIEQYKNHPAILMWEFGNEYNFLFRDHPEWINYNINNWYRALELAAQTAHSIDKNHPVSTAHGEVPTGEVVAQCPSIDIWGMNIYRNTNPESAVREWKSISNKPMYLSETGADSFDNNAGSVDEEAQGQAMVDIWNNVKGKTLGVTFMTWQDEWWKAGSLLEQNRGGKTLSVLPDNFGNEEYFGIVDINGNPKKAYTAIQNIWGAHKTNHDAAKEIPALPVKQEVKPQTKVETKTVVDNSTVIVDSNRATTVVSLQKEINAKPEIASQSTRAPPTKEEQAFAKQFKTKEQVAAKYKGIEAQIKALKESKEPVFEKAIEKAKDVLKLSLELDKLRALYRKIELEEEISSQKTKINNAIKDNQDELASAERNLRNAEKEYRELIEYIKELEENKIPMAVKDLESLNENIKEALSKSRIINKEDLASINITIGTDIQGILGDIIKIGNGYAGIQVGGKAGTIVQLGEISYGLIKNAAQNSLSAVFAYTAWADKVIEVLQWNTTDDIFLHKGGILL